jgi:TonB family protein
MRKPLILKAAVSLALLCSARQVLAQGPTGGAKPRPTPTPTGRAGNTAVAPTLKDHSDPVYPAGALRDLVAGTVGTELVVDETGHVVDAKVVRPAGHGFDEAALTAVKSWTFEPARRNDAPVRATVRWSLPFEPPPLPALAPVDAPPGAAPGSVSTSLPAAPPVPSVEQANTPPPVSNPSPAAADLPPSSSPDELPEVVVHGRADDRLGEATGASQGSVGAEDLRNLPLSRRGELLESVPGMVVTQHSGDGKANQYFLRGFNLDHGTDFAFSVDSVPVNLPSHAHGQGYSDLNFLIPEVVDSIDFKKGPFYPEVGDFSGAGAANIHLVDTLPEGIANVQLGQFNYARVLLADSPRVGPGTLLYAVEYNHYDGPWALPENSNRYNALLRYHVVKGSDEYTITGSAYWAPLWHATNQVAQRAIDEHLIGRFGNIDPTDGGRTGRDALSFDWTHQDDDATTKLVLYGFYYELNLWNDFSYALGDGISAPAVNTDQFEQVDRRLTTGAELKRTWHQVWSGAKVENTLGIQVRNDYIPDSGLNHTADRQVTNVEVHDRVEEASSGLYGNNQIQWTRWLKSELGLRADVYGAHVDSTTNAANSGSSTAGIVNPKAALVFGPWAKTEFYVDAGTGFHSNDARGTTITVDSAGVAQGRVPLLVHTKGAEVGARTSIVPGLVSTVAFWVLQSNSELTFDGDSGDTDANGPARRYGIEWSNFYKPTRWLKFSADFAFTRARYLEPEDAVDGSSGKYIANSIPVVISAAAMVDTPSGLFGGARVRYFSSQPVIEDNSARQPESTVVNALVGYRVGRYEVSFEALNLLDSKADDIAYYYPSRLPNALATSRGGQPEPAAGVDDFVIHPMEPFQVRGSLTAHF